MDQNRQGSPTKTKSELNQMRGITKYFLMIVSKWKIVLICWLISLFLFLLFLFLHHMAMSKRQIEEEDELEENYKTNTVMGNILIHLRIMPSANSVDNTVQMDYVYVPSDLNIFNLDDKSYHAFNKTRTYFTSLTLKEEYVPFGDPEPYWINLQWTPVVKGSVTNQYQPFRNMNRWTAVTKGHQIWGQNDPKDGIDLKMWRESTFNIGDWGNIEHWKYTCESTFKGIYKNSICFAYYVVEKVCISVLKEIPQKNVSESWNITSGWFKDGEYAQYTKAIPGVEYAFENVPIEVRASKWF